MKGKCFASVPDIRGDVAALETLRKENSRAAAGSGEDHGMSVCNEGEDFERFVAVLFFCNNHLKLNIHHVF